MSWLNKILGRNPESAQPLPRTEIVQIPISCEAELCAQGELNTSVVLLCDAYHLTGSFTLSEIETFVRSQKEQHPEKVLLATLDDLHQAFYTSSHCIGLDELNDVEGHDLSGLPSEVFEEGKHKGYLTTKAEFFIRKANLLRKVDKIDLSYIEGERFWSGPQEGLPSLLTPEMTKVLHREENAYVQIVPVDHPYEAVYAFPNGYFSDDYDPFQNYRLAQHLYDTFDFELFGIGATYLGFMRDTPLEGQKLQDCADFLESLFSTEEEINGTIVETLKDQTCIYFAYGDR